MMGRGWAEENQMGEELQREGSTERGGGGRRRERAEGAWGQGRVVGGAGVGVLFSEARDSPQAHPASLHADFSFLPLLGP